MGNMYVNLVTMPVHVEDEEGPDFFPNYLKNQKVTVEIDGKEKEFDILKDYYIRFMIKNVKIISHHDMPASDGHHFQILFGENGVLDMLPENLMTLYVTTNPDDYRLNTENAVVLE